MKLTKRSKVILSGLCGLTALVIVIYLVFLNGISGEFKEYLSKKYPNQLFAVGRVKIDPIYGTYYTTATCLNDQIAFPISKVWKTETINDSYPQSKSVIKYNAQIQNVFDKTDFRNYIRTVTGSSLLDDGVYTQINISLTDDAEPIVVTKKVLDVLKQDNISAERLIVTYEREKHVYEMHLTPSDFSLSEDGLKAKVLTIK